MDEVVDRSCCSVCGRPTFRHGISYTLGRRDSMPYRQWDRWRHEDDNSLACDVSTWGDRVQEFPDTM